MSSAARGKEPEIGSHPVPIAPAKGSERTPPPVMGKYAPFARLGHGGMADVYLAVARGPVGFNKIAVVKQLHRSEDLEMFLDEARLAARLSHPNIVNTYEVGEAAGQYFIAMEYLDGQPLQAVLTDWSARGEKFAEAIAGFVAMQALKGLHYAHELADYDGTPLRVVHRDVSPQNLFVTYQGEVKLLDFGIAKAALNSTQTETGVLKGKIRYMAPEQMVEKTIDRRADVFALGIVLWEMLTGTRLYGGNVTSVLARVTLEDAPSIRSVRPELSEEMEAIVAKALRRDLDERYATADAMRADLERFLSGKQEGAAHTLSRMVNEGFAVTRDAVRGRIKAFLARVPVRNGGAVNASDFSPNALPALFGEPGTDPHSSLKPIANTTKSDVSISVAGIQTPIPLAPPRGAAARLWISGAVAVALLGTVALVRPGSHSAAVAGSAPAASESIVAIPATAAGSPTTKVHLESAPSGALVEWHGAPIGRTPLDAVLAVGAQTVRISHEGYEPQEVAITVQADAPSAKAIALREIAAPDTRAAPGAGTFRSPVRRASRGSNAPSPVNPPEPSEAPAPAAAPAEAPAPPSATAPPAPARSKIRVVDDSDPN